MSTLIPITTATIGATAVQAVDARELHAALGVNKDFSDWFKSQVGRAELTEGVDFIRADVLPQKGERQNQQFGQGRIDYALSVRAAKHIAMMAGTDRGREVRDYFIECERRAQQAALDEFDVPKTYSGALRLAAELSEKVEVQHALLQRQAPAVAFVDTFVNAEGLYGLQNAARALGLRPKKFVSELKNRGFLFYEGAHLVPYAKHREKGIFEVRVATVDDKARSQTFVTPKGLTYFAKAISGGHLQGQLLAGGAQ